MRRDERRPCACTLAKELHPRTQIEIYSADGDDLKAHLDAGTIDAAVPLARETAVTTGMLEGLPLMRPHRHILRDAFEEWLANPPHA